MAHASLLAGFRPLRVTCVLFLLAQVASAEVVGVDVLRRDDAGTHERVIARVHYAVDPTLPANQAIADLAVAPRNAAGQVEFSGDLLLFLPKPSVSARGTVFLEVVNRGRDQSLGLMSACAPERSRARKLEPRRQVSPGARVYRGVPRMAVRCAARQRARPRGAVGAGHWRRSGKRRHREPEWTEPGDRPHLLRGRSGAARCHRSRFARPSMGQRRRCRERAGSLRRTAARCGGRPVSRPASPK